MMIPNKALLLFGLFFGIVSLAAAVNYRDIIVEEWNEFKALYKKAYAGDKENQFRLTVFAEVDLMNILVGLV